MEPEIVDNELMHQTAEQLEMYREYCATEIAENRDIPTFSEFRSIMNE